MKKLRLLRVGACTASSTAGLVAASSLWPIEPLAAGALACSAVLTGVALLGVELGLRAEARRRLTLRTALRKEIGELERRRGAERGAAEDLEYEREAALFHRLSTIERALGIPPLAGRTAADAEEESPR